MNVVRVEVVKTRFEKLGGLHLPLLVIDGSVDLTAAGYLTQRFDQGHPYKTLLAEANVLKKLYQFCIRNDFMPSERFASQDQLTAGEIESLAAYYSAREDTGEVVVPGTFNLRWSVTKGFLRFVWNFYQSRLKEPGRIDTGHKRLQSMEASFKLLGKTPYGKSNPDKIGLTPELKAQFFSIINPLPENQLNPWKHQYVRWRNYCLFLTMILGGNRKGESIGLKLNQFYLSGPATGRKYYDIIKDEHEDFPRIERPSVKTKERQVALSPVLAEIFEYYITKIRSSLKNSKKSQYLFLSLKDGKPIGLTTPNESIIALIGKHPQFAGKISPHILRNTYVDALREEIDREHQATGPIAKQAIMSRLMEYAGGWSTGSTMPTHYAKGTIQRKVAEFNLSVQTRILGGVVSDE